MRIAWRGNLDFSMGIVFNSGLQVALVITAAAVLAGSVVGHDVLVVFPPLELAVLGAAAIMAGARDGRRRGELDRGARAGRDLRARGARVLVSLDAGASGTGVDEAGERSEARVPQRADLGHPRGSLVERLGRRPVARLAAVALGLDEARLGKRARCLETA